MNEWISVNDCLPEDDVQVLFINRKKDEWFVGTHDEYYGWSDNEYYGLDVTHWMALPEAPKEESND